ncbi:MAG: hypothetical protein J6X53_08545 [Abditibacteriota bacterium]|nr:hypothetical protein [Abditibacteriota bacterium]
MASETMPQSRRLLTEYSLVKVRVRAAVAAGRRVWNAAFPLLLKSPSIYLSDGKGVFVELFRHFFRKNGIFSVLHNSTGFLHALVMENPVTLRVTRFKLKNPSIYLSNGKAVLAYVFGQILKILRFA